MSVFRLWRLVVAGVVGVCGLGFLGASVVFGGECAVRESAYTDCGAGWELTSRSFPTYFAPGGRGTVVVNVFNVGAGASGGPVTVTDRLPAGITAREVEIEGELHLGAGERRNLGGGINPKIRGKYWACTGNGPGASPGLEGASVVTCTSTEALGGIEGGGGNPNFAGEVEGEVGRHLDPQIAIAVRVQPGAEENVALTNHVSIAGGGAPVPASTTAPVTVSSSQPGFGFVGWDGWASNADGTIDTRAGSHPYAATFAFDLAAGEHEESGELFPAGGELRDVEVRLPPGWVANPTAVPQCRRELLLTENCPNVSQVGVMKVNFAFLGGGTIRIYNMVPPAGVPAELALNLEGSNVFLNGAVRSGSDYGINTHAEHLPQLEVIGSTATLWGVPSDPSHDPWRTDNPGGCKPEEVLTNCSIGGHPSLKPFLTLPTSCGPAEQFQVRGNSWSPDAVFTPWDTFESHDASHNPAGITGCEHLAFATLFTTSPDTSQADSPTGLTVDVSPSTGGLEEPAGLSSSDIKETTVTLPEGLVINPGQAAGLVACQESQDGLTTAAEREKGEEDNGPPACPLASKVGSVKAKTPLLEGSAEKELAGNVYVLQSNPPNLKLLAAFSADGVNIKLILNVHLNETTGQITTTVQNIPGLPASDFKLSFSGGPQAALDTPTNCGTYTSTGDFTPWASPLIAGIATTAQFEITAGPDGTTCPASPLPFKPALSAGSTTDQAGGYTNFSLLLQNGDGQQRVNGVQFKLPKGLSGMLSTIPLCPEAQANNGTCPETSEIGHAVVASGPGPYPLVIPEPGQPPATIYLTGPHNGAPFGLSIVTRVIAGPFNLGTNIVRAAINIDPHTAQITVTTDPEGPYAIPQILDGVPTDLRTIDTVIDRPKFMFNPTNCTPQTFAGTATSTQKTSVPLETHFQVGSCQSLKFKPDFKVTTTGKTSKKQGASLTAKIIYPPTPNANNLATAYAGIQSVKVDLPKQLPSRLSTLQKACLAAVFETNPENCPAASKVGHARVITPVLPVPLTGPAYFVSHGGEAFPNLTIVLQGDGVTIQLIGDTFIKKGITSNTFKSTPDTPFQLFELTLPQGPNSALAANGNLCKTKLTMPTQFTAQNGQTLKQTTKISITGCTKTKTKKSNNKKKR